MLSIVEGLTEFLPVSSTAHLVLASRVLNIPQTEFVKSFEIIIQVGAIMAVFSLYLKKLFSNLNLLKTLFIAFLPTAVVGLIFYKLVKEVLLGNLYISVLALFIGGIILIFYEKFFTPKNQNIKKMEDIPYKKAFLVGLFQSASIIPGVSRAAATILGGLFLGLDRKTAVEFSFLLAIPTMLAATFLEILKSDFNLLNNNFLYILVGLAGSFLTAFLAMKLFINYVQKNNFIVFGVYRIVLASIFWLIFLR